MASYDENQTVEEAKREADRAPGAGAYPPPHQNGNAAKLVNPFHLAIAELQADTDDMNLEPNRPAPAESPASRQTVVVNQPVRALSLGAWLGVGGAALVLGLLGGVIAQAFNRKETRSPEPVASAPDPALLAAIDSLKTRTGELSKQIDGLDAKIAALPKPPPPLDLSDLNAKVAELTETTASLKPVEGEVLAADRRASKLADAVESLRYETLKVRERLSAVETKVVAIRPTVPETSPRDDRPPSAGGVTLSQGADFFKRGRFKEALGIFNRLELSSPNDARVWYFAALSHGFATNQWGGGTAELVEKGIACERAGTPEAATIDAAFQDLTPATGKNWLDEYRKKAK
jgi:hypothetical protein